MYIFYTYSCNFILHTTKATIRIINNLSEIRKMIKEIIKINC